MGEGKGQVKVVRVQRSCAEGQRSGTLIWEGSGLNILSLHLGFTLNTLLHSDGTGDATVLQTHRYTPPEQLKINALQADIIIVACGQSNP